MLAVAAVGGARWLSAGDEDRLDTGPAEPPVTVAPEVLEQAGIWRLPEGLDGYRVLGAMDGGSYDTSNSDHPGVLAVDDPGDPQRWLMVEAYDQWGEDPTNSRQVALSDQVTAVLVPAGESTWFQLTATEADPGEAVVSGAARGVDEAELVTQLTRHFGDAPALAASQSSTDAMKAMLRDVGLDGEHQLAWLGGGADDSPPATQVLQVTLMGDDGTEVVVELVDGDQPPWAQALRLRLAGEVISMPQDGAPGLSMSMRPRPDLGPNVVETSSAVPGRPDTAGLVVITDDGVTITVTQAALVENLPSVTPLSEEQQLGIINSLRAMSESEFRAQLSELGAEFLESPPLDGTITTVQGD